MGHGPWSAWLLGCEKPIELGVSRITCHVSRATCHMPRVTFAVSVVSVVSAVRLLLSVPSDSPSLFLSLRAECSGVVDHLQA